MTPEVVLVGFAEALRHAGGGVTADRVQAFLRAVATLDPTVTADVYWAGRATLCSGPDGIERYDDVFAAWFSGDLPTAPRRSQSRASTRLVTAGAGQSGAAVAASVSEVEVLRHRDVAELTDAERAELAKHFTAMRPRLPSRRAARRRPAHTGELDPRRTLRAQLRQAGEPVRILHRRKVTRPRRVVVLVDVSGSMSPYADSLLRLAHAVTQVEPRRVEVYTIGTRLTRVTTAMRYRNPERALQTAGDTVPDWSGGTRLGEVLKVFLDRWGQRGVARGAVVVICSDGWERGDCALLADQMRRLSRLAHQVIWLNPHRGKPGYQPIQAGITAALPHIDHLVAGHSFASYADLVQTVATG